MSEEDANLKQKVNNIDPDKAVHMCCLNFDILHLCMALAISKKHMLKME